MSACAANHLIEGGGKKTLSESDRSGENVCLLPGKRKSSRAQRKSERPAREEGKGKGGEKRRRAKAGCQSFCTWPTPTPSCCAGAVNLLNNTQQTRKWVRGLLV